MPALKEPRRAERGTCTFFISYNRTVHTVRYLRPATRAKVYTGTGTGTGTCIYRYRIYRYRYGPTGKLYRWVRLQRR